MRVAICGLAESYRDAPWMDAEWETWALAWGHEYIYHASRIFEMHTREARDKLGSKRQDIWSEDNLITHENYPLEQIIKKYGDYFSCSIDYMIALAIYEDIDEISLFGINASDREYSYQRSGIEYWLGVARGKGIKVTLLADSKLLKYSPPDIHKNLGYKLRYGVI